MPPTMQADRRVGTLDDHSPFYVGHAFDVPCCLSVTWGNPEKPATLGSLAANNFSGELILDDLRGMN